MKKIISKILISLILFVTIFSNSSFNVTPVQAATIYDIQSQWVAAHPDPNGDKQLDKFYSAYASHAFSKQLIDDAWNRGGMDLPRATNFLKEINIQNYWTRPVTTTDKEMGKWDTILMWQYSQYQYETEFLMEFETNLLNSDKKVHFIEPKNSTSTWQELTSDVQDFIKDTISPVPIQGDAFTVPGKPLRLYAYVDSSSKAQMSEAVLNWLYSSDGPLFSYAGANRFLPEFTSNELSTFHDRALEDEKFFGACFLASLGLMSALAPAESKAITESATIAKDLQNKIVSGDTNSALIVSTYKNGTAIPGYEGGMTGMSRLANSVNGFRDLGDYSNFCGRAASSSLSWLGYDSNSIGGASLKVSDQLLLRLLNTEDAIWRYLDSISPDIAKTFQTVLNYAPRSIESKVVLAHSYKLGDEAAGKGWGGVAGFTRSTRMSQRSMPEPRDIDNMGFKYTNYISGILDDDINSVGRIQAEIIARHEQVERVILATRDREFHHVFDFWGTGEVLTEYDPKIAQITEGLIDDIDINSMIKDGFSFDSIMKYYLQMKSPYKTYREMILELEELHKLILSKTNPNITINQVSQQWIKMATTSRDLTPVGIPETTNQIGDLAGAPHLWEKLNTLIESDSVTGTGEYLDQAKSLLDQVSQKIIELYGK